MISTDGFPINLVNALQGTVGANGNVKKTLLRRLRPTDPDGSLAIFPTDWTPGETEIGGPGNAGAMLGGGGDVRDPTFQSHGVELHFLIRIAGDLAGGTAQSAAMAKIIRQMLYRDVPTAVALRACSETTDGYTERVQTWKVMGTKYHDSPMPPNTFIFLSTTRLLVQTQTSQTPV